MLQKLVYIIICSTVILVSSAGYAANKNWGGAGDASSWSDDDNWFPASVPVSGDDVVIDISNTSVVCTQTFTAKSVTIGGRTTTSLTSNNFIYGTIAPDSGSDTAILNRSGGTFKLIGGGVVTVKGKYIDSNESLTSEPSFLFWAE